MALASSGITTSLVGNTLGISNRNVGGLCTSSNVNPWSSGSLYIVLYLQ